MGPEGTVGAAILGVQGIWEGRCGSPTCRDIPVGATPVVTSLLHSHLSRCPCGFHSRDPSVTGSSCQFPNSRELWVMPPGPSSSPHPEILLNLPESAQICRFWPKSAPRKPRQEAVAEAHLGIKRVIWGETLCACRVLGIQELRGW